MGAKERRGRELAEGRDARRARLVAAARRLFDERGIEGTSLAEVASRAEVGVASLYRYFGAKSELVAAVGVDYCDEVAGRLAAAPPVGDGLERIGGFLALFRDLVGTDPAFLRFLEAFDAYFAVDANRTPSLRGFEQSVSAFHPYVLDALAAGEADGSIRPGLDRRHVGAVIFRAYASYAQRLISRGSVLSFDAGLEPGAQLDVLEAMILDFLRPRPGA